MGEAQGMSNERQRWPAAPGGRPAPQGATGSTGISPIKAFAGLVALLIVAGTLLLLTRPDASDRFTATSTAGGGSLAITDSQALARFRKLDALRRRAYVQKDASLLSTFLTSNSPLRASGAQDIQQLQESDISFKPHTQTRSLVVERNVPTEIVIEQRLIQRARFFSDLGQDVTARPKTLLMSVRWWMRPEDGTWKLHDSAVLHAKELDPSNS